MSRAGISTKATLWVAAALAGFALARLAPPLAGLTPLGQSVLGAAFAGTLLWVSEAIPLGHTALVVLLLLGLSPGLGMADVAGGFAGDVVFFLIGAVALGTAVEASGLAARAARFLGRERRQQSDAALRAADRRHPGAGAARPLGHHPQRHPDTRLPRRADRHGRGQRRRVQRARSCWRSASSIRWPHRRS